MGLFILEFLEPQESLNATVLMRCTYNGPLQKLGKSHPQAPPLHLHLDQSESYWVAKGTVGTTHGWENADYIRSSKDGACHVAPWVPHRFCIWAHPDGTLQLMDKLFFENILTYISDVSEGKAKMSILQVMVSQHATAAAMIMFPRAWWLGPLRWWVPWKFQALCASIGHFLGYRELMERYTAKEDWEEFLKAKKALLDKRIILHVMARSCFCLHAWGDALTRQGLFFWTRSEILTGMFDMQVRRRRVLVMRAFLSLRFG